MSDTKRVLLVIEGDELTEFSRDKYIRLLGNVLHLDHYDATVRVATPADLDPSDCAQMLGLDADIMDLILEALGDWVGIEDAGTLYGVVSDAAALVRGAESEGTDGE